MKPSLPSAVIRRQQASAQGSHPAEFRPWRWGVLTALLITAATLGGVFFGVAQAQDANGAITGLALTSDTPGELVVSWDMPSPAPSDYRVDWAESSESYQSYTVNEGHVYPEGNLTTVTITGLEAGAEYKVRMRARYHDGEHADSPWSGPWAEARLAVAAEPEPTPEPTEEPAPEPGAIGSATAAADDPQTLVITWEEPADPHDNPTDYRVNWARSDDDYPSYTDEDGNAHPTGATQTLEGLDHDTEYKIRIRARYSPNDQYDEHWSGPWTEIRARVVSSPPSAPAAPSLIGTAVTPEGHVTLLWLNPEDDSITGYRVLRGPDADSLAVIQEDTGSTAVSYTDTEPPAGQTHTYAVQARSAAGLSPMSNTRTATVPANEEEPAPQRQQHESSDATLSSLTVSPEDIIGFAPDRTSYEVGVASTITRATVAGTATNSGAGVAYSPADADTSTTMVHDVDLSAGRNAVTVTVTAQDGNTTETYTVSVNRGVSDDYGWKAMDDLDGLIAAGNDNPRGIWSNGATMWVADSFDDKLYAYHTDGARDSSKDFNTLAGANNTNPTGIWSNGTTMWVGDTEDDKIYAYQVSDKTYDASKDFNTLGGASNNNPRGIWSDGDTMWVADSVDDKIYAYQVSDKTRDASKEFNTLGGASNNNPRGIWSDGDTMWVADSVDDKLYAYRMSDKTRDASKEFNTLSGAGNHNSYAIWSYGATMWVSDLQDAKVYSYNMPPSSSDATLSALTVSPTDIIGFDPDRTDYEVGVASTVSRATITAAATNSDASVAYSPADADTSTTIHDVDLSAGANAVTVTVTAEDGSTEDYTVSVNRGVTDAYGWKAVDDLDGLIAAGNTSPYGIWSDGATMWVADSSDGKLYAYNPNTKAPDASQDFTTLSGAENRSPNGIWSDGATMWVTDGFDRKIYAYRMSDQTRDTSKEFNTLNGAANDSPAGIWSDGTTMWVADSFDGKIYAYRMSDQTRDTSKDFNTLSVAGNDNPSGIWSDGTTMWVADRGNGKIYAYRMSNKARNASKEFTTLSGAGNNDPFGIWSDGDTMWVADWVDDKVYSYNMPPSSDATLRSLTVSPQDIIGFAPDRTTYEVGVEATITRATITATASDSNASVAYSPADADTSTTIHDVDLSTGANAVTITVTAEDGSTEDYTVSVNRGVTDAYGWKAVDDLDGLIAAGNTSPYGIWSDGATMWVADSSDGKLYAYNPNTKAPDASQDFTTLSGAENRSPNGIWSDGATMWVTDGFDRKIYAYRMSDQTRDTSKEFNTLNGAANDSPAGIWSDGTTMWVADSFDGKIYAYRMSDQTHDTSKDFNTLGSAGNDNPSGIWSDGTTMWVADRGNGKIYAYRMSNKARDASQDFTTLSGAGNNDPFGIWSDGDTMWVADWVDDKVYSYNMPPSSDATLRSLTVSPQDIIGFAPDRTSYEVGVASTETRATITATANHSAASVTYSPADADASTTIHDLDLSAGRNAVTVTVTSQDGSATRDYTVSVNRGVADDYGWKASDDLDGLIAAGNNPIGIWSNGVTTWVADFIDDKLYAYNTDGTRDASQDFDTLSGAGNRDPSGIWSDGKTMWVTDSIDGKIYAYNTDGTRDSDEDFTTLRDAGNRDPYGIWSDGATMWVTDGFDRKIYAYRMSDQTRDTSKEFNTLSVAGNGDPTGIWSDDNTMWVADWVDDKIYAYQMSDKTRDSGKDFTTLSGASNNYPTGIWSDGDTMWVADWVDDKVYSYNSPSSDATLSALTLVTNLGNTGQDSMVVRPDKPYATTFVTAPGARIIYKLSGVEMRAAKEVGSYDSPVPQVSLYRDAGGRPGSQLYTLTGPDDFLSEDDTEFRTYTFTAPQGASLDAGVAYWVVFAGASGSTHYRVDSTTETAQTGDGWSIGDISMDRESGGWLPTTIGPAKFAVLGAEIDLQETATTLVTNLDPAGTEALTVSGAERRATSFTTAAAGPWVRYEFSGIQIRTQRGVASLRPTPLVTVHRDVGGRPAAAPLFTLDPPGDFLSTVDTDFHVNTFTAPSGAFLDPGATYWVVFAVESINYQVQATDDTTQTGDGWMIGDVYSFFVSGNWHTGSTGPAQFAVLGTGVGLLDEDPDVDLPGGAHDCQLTDGVVVVGHTSSGHLTAGVDTSSGLTGDCFRLETQWGKQYRVEVKFGDTESVDIGGSAWIVYTGSDFSGMSSLGSAVDHNREDGRSFTDFKHIHNKVKSYFVDVAAYDLYSTPHSTNSLTYNGPYTITMKDITGVQRMVTNIDPTLGSPVDYETGLSLSDGGTITLAAPFITGDHPEGYALDRIRVPFDDIADEGASPLISIYSNSSDTPSAKLCDLDRPAQIVESAVTWSGNPPPFTFLADDCAYNTLAASTPYWVVFTGVDPADYTLEMTNSAEEHDYYGTGWTMDNFLARSTDGGASWTVTAANAGNIRIEFWAKPKTNSATGEPLARGQRFLPGQELTAGPGTVSDPDGTSRANYRYQWRRTDDQGVSTVIEGATGASYIITDDDRGHRVWVIVFFLDDAGNEESRASMATSYVPGQTRILIKKSGGTNNRAHGTVGLSSGFYTAAEDLKHRIESVTQILTAAGIGNINTDLFRFRLFTSNDASNPLDRKPAVEIATFTNPARVATGQKKFTAPTDALLAGGTTYHIVMYTGGAGEIGCEQLGSSQAHDGSLPNWELIQRTYPLTSENTAGSAYFGDPCNMRIDGYQLADAPHITSLEITSTPNTSPSYETGETISVTATLSEAVNFTGPEPVLPIRIGDNTREAIYDAGSSTTTQWVFQYIVLEEDRDDDGISVEQHALRAYADADLSHNAISTAPSHRVNARSLLRSVRVTSKPEAPNWYGPGETIQFTAEFTLPVTVTGDPEFAFSITSGGSTHARATYIGTTENRIVFEYTISTTDDDSNGIWIGDHTDTLRLDGDDAIVGVSNGRTAVLDHPEIGRLASHRIDQNPRIVTVAVTSDPTHGTNSDIYAPGEVIEFTATFNQEVNVVGDPEFEFSIDSGSADERAAYHSGSGTKAIVFRYTIVAADIDPSGIWIGDQTRTFKLDADDSIRGVSNSLDAVLDHRGLGILTGHKIDNMITP